MGNNGGDNAFLEMSNMLDQEAVLPSKPLLEQEFSLYIYDS